MAELCGATSQLETQSANKYFERECCKASFLGLFQVRLGFLDFPVEVCLMLVLGV